MSNSSINANLTHPHIPSSSTTLSPTVLKEIQDANVPLFMTGLLLPHALCTIFITSRIASRLWVTRKWFLDETLILIAWLFSTALCVVYSITATTPSLLGAPSLSSTATADTDANPYIMRTYLGLIYYQLALCLTKLSILALYLRVFASSSRPRERLFARAAVAFVLLYTLPLLLMSFLQCNPVQGQFFSRPVPVCFRFPDLLIASASLHSATDAWLVAMVVPSVARLDLPRRQKIALAVVMSLSVLVIVASMVRLQLSLHLHYRPTDDAGVRNTLGFFIMTVLECDLAIMCASAPTLRPLLARLFPSVMMSSAKRRSLEAGNAETQSFDLTSLTYHGYPWTEPSTPAGLAARSRNASIASHLNKLRMPAPPLPTLTMAQLGPAKLSLGNLLITGTAPRRPGRSWHVAEDGKPILFETAERRVAGAAGYKTQASSIYSQDMTCSGDESWREEEEFEKKGGVILKTMRLSLRSEYVTQNETDGVEKETGGSIDRSSPTSGFSGDTWAVDRSSSGTAGDDGVGGRTRIGRFMEEIPQEEAVETPEVPKRSPLRDSRRR
ncbi:integral membrane protein [Colletotrichum nymphaeae SA-01]|uniref:Integral membrane protein n=1 Tax=Colletotrichum nymphaeae SA-01 TaxID=1460502 RepID=A0A135SEB7_9PEZI|nr:integral membrane protein [Colletotrichum nymphaeae SA-01]